MVRNLQFEDGKMIPASQYFSSGEMSVVELTAEEVKVAEPPPGKLCFFSLIPHDCPRLPSLLGPVSHPPCGFRMCRQWGGSARGTGSLAGMGPAGWARGSCFSDRHWGKSLGVLWA